MTKIDTTNKTLSNDDRWIYRLWKWADRNNIPDLEWVEDKNSNKGYWRGLPRDKEKLLSLTELNLSFNHNPITRLPKEIGNLTNLKKLFIRGNNLRRLPKEIANLTNLTYLDVSKNQLTELTEEIFNLINLTKLDISDNQLRELPKEIGNLILAKTN